MAASGQQHEQALKRFLEQRPELRVELDNLNPLLAQVKGETLAQYRDERLHEAFEAEAERLGLFAWELTLLLTAATPEDYQAQRLDVHREVAEMAGLRLAGILRVIWINPLNVSLKDAAADAAFVFKYPRQFQTFAHSEMARAHRSEPGGVALGAGRHDRRHRFHGQR